MFDRDLIVKIVKLYLGGRTISELRTYLDIHFTRVMIEAGVIDFFLLTLEKDIKSSAFYTDKSILYTNEDTYIEKQFFKHFPKYRSESSEKKEDKATIGVKYDNNKLKYGLIPIKFIERLCEVMNHGANKYGEFNWTGLSVERIYNSLFRHLVAYRKDPESKDSDSEFKHIDMLISNIMILWCLENESKLKLKRKFKEEEEDNDWDLGDEF